MFENCEMSLACGSPTVASYISILKESWETSRREINWQNWQKCSFLNIVQMVFDPPSPLLIWTLSCGFVSLLGEELKGFNSTSRTVKSSAIWGNTWHVLSSQQMQLIIPIANILVINAEEFRSHGTMWPVRSCIFLQPAPYPHSGSHSQKVKSNFHIGTHTKFANPTPRIALSVRYRKVPHHL